MDEGGDCFSTILRRGLTIDDDGESDDDASVYVFPSGSEVYNILVQFDFDSAHQKYIYVSHPTLSQLDKDEHCVYVKVTDYTVTIKVDSVTVVDIVKEHTLVSNGHVKLKLYAFNEDDDNDDNDIIGYIHSIGFHSHPSDEIMT